MRTTCAIMDSRVTPPVEDEGAEVDGAIEARGVTISIQGRLGLSYASLRQIVAVSIALITVDYLLWC